MQVRRMETLVQVASVDDSAWSPCLLMLTHPTMGLDVDAELGEKDIGAYMEEGITAQISHRTCMSKHAA